MSLRNTTNSRLSTINKYRRLSEIGKVKELKCFKDDGTHLPLIPTVDYDDNIFLECLSCDYKTTVGLDLVDRLQKFVDDYSE